MKENRIPRLLTVLIIGGCCLLLAVSMMLTPLLVGLLRGEKTVILPEEEKEETSAEPTPTVPIDGLTAPAVYAPENMFWILQNGEPTDIIKASIPEGSKANRPNARLLYQEKRMRDLVNGLNRLLPLEVMTSSVKLDPSTVKGKERYTLRFGDGERDAVTFYEGGYFSYVGTDHIVNIKTNVGYTLLKSAYDQATTAAYYYENGLYEQGFAKLWRPSASKLQNGGRIYRIGDDVYCYPMTAAEAFEHKAASSQYPVTLSSDDVTYLIKLIDEIAASGWIAAVPAPLHDPEGKSETARLVSFPLGSYDVYDRSREREVLLAWLSLFSDPVSLCSIGGSPAPDCFWYFPSMKSEEHAADLLAYLQGEKELSELTFSVFCVDKSAQYYKRPATSEPQIRGLIELSHDDIPRIPSVSDDVLPEDVFAVGHNVSRAELMSVTVPNIGKGESLPYSCTLVSSAADMRWLAEEINSLVYRTDRPIVAKDEIRDNRLLIRYGHSAEDVVTVYQSGYVSFGTRDYARTVPMDRWDSIAALFDWYYALSDTESFCFQNVLRVRIGAKTKPSSSILSEGGRLYFEGSKHLYYVLLTEEERNAYHKKQTETVFSPSVKDVTYMLEVIELAAKKDAKIYLPAHSFEQAIVFLPSDMKHEEDGLYTKRAILTNWLLSLSQNAIYTVDFLIPPGGTDPTTPTFGAFRQHDYWFIPSSSADFDPNLLLAHFTETENREALDFPAFHIHEGGVDYYESLAENDPVRLLGNT